jgi:hypothetical protein
VSLLLSSVLFALFGLVLPGIALQRLLRLRVDPAVVLPSGFLLAAFTYGLGLALSFPLLFPGVALALDLFLAFSWRGTSFSKAGPLAPVVVMVGVLAFTEYPLQRADGRGPFLLDPVHPEDQAFHAGLAWELTHTYPPEVPGFSGERMTYHFGLPLVRAAACRFAGIRPYDSLTRLDNTLGVLALALALSGAVSALGGSGGAFALAPWFLLATDLSFLFALKKSLPFWISSTKGSDILFSLLQANANVPALALALAALIALKRSLAGEGKGWILLASALAVGCAAFKVFVAGQLLLGLVWAALLSKDRRASLTMAIPLGLVLGILALGQGGEGVFFDPLVVLRDVRQNLDLAKASEAVPVTFLVLWLLLSLGLRIVGLPGALRAFLSRDALGLALSAMALSGWPIGLLFRISPLGTPDKPQNEALYFFEQSGLLLWLFVAVALGSLQGRKRLLGVLCLALSLPSTVQFVLQMARLPRGKVPREVVEAMAALEGATRPGDVVLERPGLERIPPPPLVFIGRRVAYASYFPFLTQWIAKPALEERRALVKRFFEAKDEEEALGIARSLGARALCLYGSDSVGFEMRGFKEVFTGETARVYLLP